MSYVDTLPKNDSLDSLDVDGLRTALLANVELKYRLMGSTDLQDEADLLGYSLEDGDPIEFVMNHFRHLPTDELFAHACVYGDDDF